MTLLCLVVYANSLPNPFMFDDDSIIRDDPRVQQGGVLELVTGNYWYLPNSPRHYRPLVKVSYALNWMVSQEAWTFRVIDLAMHAGTCVLLYHLAWGMFRSFWTAIAAAVLFAVHPVHTEALNTIVGRADLAAALGVLGSALLYWRDGAADATPSRWRPLAAVLLFAGSLLCKENAVTAIAVVAVLDGWRRRQGQRLDGAWWRRRAVRVYVPLLLVSAAYVVVATAIVGPALNVPASPIDNPMATPSAGLAPGDSPVLARWATPVVTFGLAAGLMVWPTGLCCDYSYAAIDTVKRLSDPRLWKGLAWVALTGGAIVGSYRRKGQIAAALAIALVTYSIVSNVPVVIGTIFAERLLYLPSVGVCLGVGLLACALSTRCRARVRAVRWVARGAFAMLLVSAGWFAVLTIERNRDWRSHRSLWQAAEAVNPRSCRVLTNLAADAADSGQDERAMGYANRAIEVAPAFWRPWRIVAVVYRRQQKLDEAYRCFEQAIRLGAGADYATVLGTTELLTLRGETARAIDLLRGALEFRPLWQAGRLQLAELLARTQRFDEAFDQLERVLHRDPDNVEALNNMAWFLVSAEPPSLRDPVRALTFSQRAVALASTNGAVIDTHVEVLLALERIPEAAQVLERALRDVPADDPFRAVLAEKLRKLRP